jgi:dephospho-CoA kinase
MSGLETPRPERPGPRILGLTGSIGMGKSTVAAMLRDLGVPVFDADAAVHELQGPDGALLPAIEARFPGTTGPVGELLAIAVLEAIVHPAVAELRQAFLRHHADRPLVVFDIPLLFEKSGALALDAVAVVSAPAPTQRARVLARPGMSVEKFEQILALQVPDAEKRARADFVIDTGTDLATTRAAVERLVRRIAP